MRQPTRLRKVHHAVHALVREEVAAAREVLERVRAAFLDVVRDAKARTHTARPRVNVVRPKRTPDPFAPNRLRKRPSRAARKAARVSGRSNGATT